MGVYYLLRHRPSGAFMPDRGKGMRRHTHSEPAHYPAVPRLFAARLGATVALAYWLQGRTTAPRVDRSDGGPGGDRDWSTRPVAGRVREEWEIVPVRIVPDAAP